MNILVLRIFTLFCLGILTLLQAENPLRALDLPEQTQKFYQNIAPSDELDDFEKERGDPFVSRGDLALELEDYAHKFYVGEVFALELYAKTTEETNFDFKISLLKNEDLLFLSPNPKWDRVKGGYKSTLWFEAKSPNANLEQITTSLLRNKKAFEKASIHLEDIRFESTPTASNFSHLVASSLEIKKVKTSYFNDKNVIMMLELSAKNANLKSFFMQGVQRQGIENLKGDFNASTGFYYAVFPAHKKEFSFSYFNKESKKLENFNLRLQISDDEISTQSDLNPTSKSYNIYKQYALWALAFILAALFVWKKGYFILALALLSFSLGFLVDTNTQSGMLKSGARVQILPTENSTLFYTADSSQRVEILVKRGKYTKILLNDGKIGWANNADLRKD